MNRQSTILFVIFFVLSVSSLAAGANNNDILIQNVEWDGEEYRLQHDFNVFKHKFNKTYTSPQEEAFRFLVFKANMRQEMQRHKKLIDPSAVHYGFTKFSDMTATELMIKKHIGLKI
uniref:cysteine protease RD19A-like n=1 Tax=Erigeron canadensis TaxID=72917 RepID=UPI001CB9C409|nr:cysteine protease RD19A-like [Erigeron canadensis]